MQVKFKQENRRELFYFLSAVMVLSVIFELVWPGSVLVYLNVNYIFIGWVISLLLLL